MRYATHLGKEVTLTSNQLRAFKGTTQRLKFQDLSSAGDPSNTLGEILTLCLQEHMLL